MLEDMHPRASVAACKVVFMLILPLILLDGKQTIERRPVLSMWLRFAAAEVCQGYELLHVASSVHRSDLKCPEFYGELHGD